ncbi:restriction system protein [Alteromonadaceae bacterium 2753L.S.0a.02]|nr:restriction system protein [Alteromonadaceae bacterium 2753L.S.0a.02]
MIPVYQSLMHPLLRALGDGQARRTRDLVQMLADTLNLTEEERSQLLPSGKQAIFNNRVGWARTYLKKAGLIETPEHGFMRITERGANVLQQNPPLVDNEYLKQFPEFLEYMSYSSSQGNDVSSATVSDTARETPTEAMDQAYRQFNAELATEVLDTVLKVTPQFFEELVVKLMLAMGYGGWSEESGRATQYSADGGIDGLINEDPLGLETIYLQAKRYKDNTVGREAIQAFSGALDMQRAHKGVFITTSKFSKGALEYVGMIQKKIILIDGVKLAALMIKHNLGVSVKETYEIKAIDTDFFNED